MYYERGNRRGALRAETLAETLGACQAEAMSNERDPSGRPRAPGPPSAPGGSPPATAVPSIGGAPFADGTPGQAHFARSVLLALRARDTEALARLVVPAARDRILALAAASDSWAFLAAAASDEVRLRTDGTSTLAAFGESGGLDVAVLRMRLAPDGRMRLEDVAELPAAAFERFGRPL